MPSPEPGWSLRRRLQLIITIALLPIALVSVLQGIARAQLDVAAARERLIQSARATATGDENLIASAEQILRAVSSLPDVRDISGDCDTILADTLVGVRYFSNLSRADADGRVACSAMPLAKGLSIADMEVFQRARRSGALVVSGQVRSRVTGQNVVGALLPLKKEDGSFNGTVGIGLDVHWIDYMLRASSLPKGAVVAVYDHDGQLLASNNRALGTIIAAAEKKAGFSDGASRDVSDGGEVSWHYATASLSGSAIYLAYAMEANQLFGQTYLHVGLDFFIPILSIALAWGAIWWFTDRQVTQWIFYLRRFAAAYRSGHYALRPDLGEAPAEFRLLGSAFSEMAEGIESRDKRLHEAVEQKITLIKEIHHRVKNNLQIVMSLLSIQAGQVKDPTAKEALMQAQTRINALALVHRILNELEDQSTLDLKQLLEELCRQIGEGIGAENVKVVVEVPSKVVTGSVAVAVALFTVEALTNIFKHAFPPGGDGVIRVTMQTLEGGKLRLAIADNGIGFVDGEASKSVGSRLIKTFGIQLGGISQVRSIAGEGTVVELIFPDPDLSPETAAGATNV
ncbi:MAG: sensor histidine kinase [Alphaproteobacteria bacterium]|nr:sensor histidine kinase [Alphaproteobacteria bacterium]